MYKCICDICEIILKYFNIESYKYSSIHTDPLLADQEDNNIDIEIESSQLSMEHMYTSPNISYSDDESDEEYYNEEDQDEERSDKVDEIIQMFKKQKLKYTNL